MTRSLRLLAILCVLLVLPFAAVAPWAGTSLVLVRPLSAPDAIVSLGSHEWERLPLAARLARDHSGAVVVLTLPEVPSKFNCHDCGNRAAYLERHGVAPARVHVVDLPMANTYGEARAVLDFAHEEGLRRILVVTSPYHARRALATFEHVFDGSGIELGLVHARETSPARPTRWLLAGYDRAYVGYEWAAIVWYRVKYGVPLGRTG